MGRWKEKKKCREIEGDSGRGKGKNIERRQEKEKRAARR